MSAVEEIEAAIVKLAGLKGSAPTGPWQSGQTTVWSRDSVTVVLTPGHDPHPETVDLIAILHRTIDAQLAFLVVVRDLDMGAALEPLSHSGFFGKVLDLARAINGTP